MKILVYPKDKNPYQNLLYKNIKDKVNLKYLGSNPSNTINLILLPFQLFYNRIIGYNIFHLHWTYQFQSPIKNKLFNNSFTRFIYTSYFLLILILLKLLKYKLVWTVHNIIPHESQFIGEMKVRKFLSKMCNTKIVHSNETILEMKKLGLDIKNTFVIPHGSYIGVYPNNKKNAKKEFNFKENDFVFLFIGNIREYKGIPELLKSFSQIKNQNVKLLIAGNCGDLESKKLLEKYSKTDKRIKFIEGFVEDNDIQKYMNACDVIVYPFRKITTSGSVLLSCSFGKAIIFPKLGGLKELPKNIGYSYNSKDKNGLLNCMKESIKDKKKLKQTGKNSFEYAQSLSWEKIGNKTLTVYEK